MPKVAKGMKQFSVQVPIETYEGMTALAARLGRAFSREVTEAFRRHLANPPTLVDRPHDDAPPARVSPAPARYKASPPADGPSDVVRALMAKKPTKPQKAAERRTSALEELADLDGTTRVSTKDERPSHANDEGSCTNLD